ncbi:MAG: phage tail protein [Acidimicrobiales bacterium]
MSDAAAGTVAASAQPGAWNEPFRSYLFKLILDGGTDAAFFNAVSGLGMDVEAIEWREAGSNSIVRQLPGRISYSYVTLSYGLTSSDDMWQWMLSAASGSVRRRQVSIAMLDPTGIDEVLRWNLLDAWPKSWQGAPLDALGQTAAIERMTLVHEGLSRDDTRPTPPTPAPAPPAS